MGYHIGNSSLWRKILHKESRMFSGRYSVTLDDRSRMRIPVKLKEKLGENFYMTGGFDGCAFLMSEEQLKTFVDPVQSRVRFGDAEGMQNMRTFYATVYEMTPDNQGRYSMPLPLKKGIKADKKLVFLGAFDRIEVWPEEVFVKKFEGDQQKINDAVVMFGMMK